METGKASILTFVEPMVAMLLSSLVFREAFTWTYALGMAAILAALVILNLPSPSGIVWRRPPVLTKGTMRIGKPAV